METATINISMPKSLKADVDEIIAADGYGNTSEFFRDLVRTYKERRRERTLESLIQKAIDSGPATPLTKADFDEIREGVTARILERKK